MVETSAETILSYEWGWSKFRRDVFQLLAWGYQDAKARIQQEHLEENITELLREAIDDRLQQDSSLPARFILYNAKNEDPISGTGRRGKARPKVDITIEHTGNRPYKRYRLEAKRCARKYKSGIKWYADGIKVYVQRTYAREAPEAAVVGLVQSDTPAHWKAQLQKTVQATDITVISDLSNMAVSTHHRDDGSLIDLYHVFLDCTKP